MSQEILVVGPGGDVCSVARSDIAEEIRETVSDVVVQHLKPAELNNKTACDYAIAFDSTLVSSDNTIEGPEDVADFVRSRLKRVVPVVVINIGNDEVVIVRYPGDREFAGKREIGEVLRELLAE